jgi:hypothetical protein
MLIGGFIAWMYLVINPSLEIVLEILLEIQWCSSLERHCSVFREKNTIESPIEFLIESPIRPQSIASSYSYDHYKLYRISNTIWMLTNKIQRAVSHWRWKLGLRYTSYRNANSYIPFYCILKYHFQVLTYKLYFPLTELLVDGEVRSLDSIAKLWFLIPV